MKQRYLLIIVICVQLTMIVNAQTWRQVATQSEPNYSSSFFLYANIGWYVGNAGLMKKTVDGGETWTDISTGITENLSSVYFVNNNLGFVGISGTKIYKTTNAGVSWTPITVTGAVATSGSIVSIYFADEQRGWALSSSSSVGKVLQTIDGGITWTVGADNPSGDLEAMHFYSPTAGIAVGGGVGKCDLWYTKNGTTWTKAAAPSFPAGYTRTDIKGIFMLNENLAYATGWGSLIGAQASIQLKSYDGGATWTYLTQAEQNKTFDNMYGLYFKDENNGFAVGGAIRGSVAVRTTDGGANWIPFTIPCGATLNQIQGFGSFIVISTNSNTFITSNDFGNTWKINTKIPSATLYSIQALSDNIIYAAGYDGIVMKSVDGGDSWASTYAAANKVCPNIQAIHFVNENVGYTAQSYNMIAKTVDGGKTWTQVKKDTTANALINYGIYFVNENLGFAVGKVATNVDHIYKTTNGGASWTTKTAITSATLRGVAFYDAQKGVVVGEKLKAAYTIDGGNTWTLSTFSGVPTGSASANLRDVVFLNSTDVIAVGDKVILKSTNGGASYTYINIPELQELLTGVGFNSASNGWTVGVKSASPKALGVYQTTNGGAGWINKVNLSVFDINGTIYDVSVTPSGYAYVCAGNSTIYTSAPVTDVDDKETIPEVFSLSQNYPNPFNPSTTIKYSLAKAEHVTLKIYDLLGKEVATLVNEFQQPGIYNSQFLASSPTSRNGSIQNSQLSSGVYFYTLQAGSFTVTKKLIYLK